MDDGDRLRRRAAPPTPRPRLGARDDGHWKPPPFSLETDRSRTAAGPGPAGTPAGPGPATWPVQGPATAPAGDRARGSRAPVPLLVGLAVVAALVVGVGGVLLLGGGSDAATDADGTSPAAMADDPADGTVLPDDGFVPIPMDDEAAPTTASPELAGTTCPTVEAVATVVEEADGVTPPEPRGTQIDLNEVVFDAAVCDYGATTGIARLASESPETDLARLVASSGRFLVRRDGDDVWVTLPDHDGRGSVRLVFIHEGELWSVARNGSDGTQVRQLADLVIAG